MKKFTSGFLAFILMLSILPVHSFAAQDPTFEADLEAYLQEISEIRGFEVTKDDIEIVLSSYEEELANFENVDDLSEFLGEVIESDYSNLEEMLSSYDMTMEELNKLFEENDENIDDYVFMDNISDTIFFYMEPEMPEFDEEFTEDLLVTFQEELGLTEQELNNLEEHLMALEEELSTPEAIEKFESLAERMEAFADFETLDDLTPEQISEMMSIYNELFTMLQLKLDFYLVKDGKESPITIMDVFKMEELINAKLKVNVFDLNGKKLADLLITGEMVDGDTIRDIGNDLGTATDKVEKTVNAKTKVKSAKIKTEKGGKLPKTAGNYAMNALIGLSMALSGFILFRKYRRV